MSVSPNRLPDKTDDNQKDRNFESSGHIKSRFRESALVNPAIHIATLSGDTHQMVRMLTLAELIDVGNLRLAALARRTILGVCVDIVLIASKVDNVANLRGPRLVRINHSQILRIDGAVNCVLTIDRLVDNHTVAIGCLCNNLVLSNYPIGDILARIVGCVLCNRHHIALLDVGHRGSGGLRVLCAPLAA